MNEASPNTDVPINRETEDGDREEQEMDRGGQRLELPEDGYEWKKYGQKFIKNIGKFRSYFKCQRANCTVKKKAEWSPSEPDNIRIVYDGVHSHASSTLESGSSQGTSSANQYNLLTQVFGNQSTSCRPRGN